MQNNIVRHVLVFRFKPATTAEQLHTFFTAFHEMSGKIAGIDSFEYGANNSTEGLNQDMTHVVMVTFANAQARDAYLPHPEHRKFVDLLNKMGIVEKLLVIDYSPQ
jgi:Stress responsive A/B Barrel Domain